jgi:hypothetical protein
MWTPTRREIGEGSMEREEPGAGARHHDNHSAPVQSAGVGNTARQSGARGGTGTALPEKAAQGAIARHPSVFDETDFRRVGRVPAPGSRCVALLRESAMKPVGKPDAGNRHVRFDERGWESGRPETGHHPRLTSTLTRARMLDVSNSAASESINSKIQWVKYTARGFRSETKLHHHHLLPLQWT